MPHARGSITVEILIAFAVFTLMASAILLVSRGAEAAAEATRIETELASLVDVMFSTGEYKSHYLSACMRLIEAQATQERYSISRTRYIADIEESERRGGDCASFGSGRLGFVAPYSGVEAEEATAVDALGPYVFAGTSIAPYVQTLAHGSSVSYENGFSLPAKPNALDAFHTRNEDGTTRTYVAFALATSTSQFALADMTDAFRPLLLATSSLAGVVATGSEPSGWRILYYGGYVYVSTKETAGPELHVFNVSNPTLVTEVGSGISVNSTINDLSAQHGKLYTATSRDSGEIATYAIQPDGTLRENVDERMDLPGLQDGESVYTAGDTLFLGRASNTAGPEFYAFRIVENELQLLGSADIPAVSITGIQVAGGYAYLAATPTGISTRRLDVYDVHDPVSLVRAGSHAIPGLSMRGIDVSVGGIYAASVRDPMMRFLPFE